MGETFKGIAKRIRLATLRIQFAHRRHVRYWRRILWLSRKAQVPSFLVEPERKQ